MAVRINHGQFEILGHTGFGGRKESVPLFIDRREGLSHDSVALLQAVNIVGANLEPFGDDVATFYHDLTEFIASKAEGGIVIADSHGAGSVSIGPEITTVAVRALGEWEISTELFADMIGYWADIPVEERNLHP